MTFKVPSLSTKKSLEEACRVYEERLEGSVAEEYLLNRGITKEAQTYFRLGFVGENPSPGHEFKENRLAIPYLTPSGIVQMRFRAVPEDGILGNPEQSPKMLSLADAGTNLYNAKDMVIDSDTIYMVEGESDTWTVHMAEVPVVGIPGAKAWPKLRRVSRAFRFRKVIFLADNDDAGEGLKLAQEIQADIRQMRIILMPDKYDVNSFYRENGLDALKEKMGL